VPCGPVTIAMTVTRGRLSAFPVFILVPQ
jgi:hypothetical protein